MANRLNTRPHEKKQVMSNAGGAMITIILVLTVALGSVGLVIGLICAGVYVAVKAVSNKAAKAAPVQKHPFDLQQERKNGLQPRTPRFRQVPKDEEIHHVGTAAPEDSHRRKKRLEQLEVLRGAGLYTKAEYEAAKARIIRETE